MGNCQSDQPIIASSRLLYFENDYDQFDELIGEGAFFKVYRSGAHVFKVIDLANCSDFQKKYLKN